MPISQSGGAGILPLYETSPVPQGGNLIALTTQTVTWSSPDLVMPACQGIIWLPVITAISGTSPTVQFFVQVKDSSGVYRNVGLNTGSLTAAGSGLIGHSLAQTSVPVISFIYRIQAVIGGTTPSVSFFVDQYYK